VRGAIAHHPGITPQLATFAYAGYVADLTRACLLGLLTLATAWLASRGKLPAVPATLIVLALMLFELWPVSSRVMQPVIGDVSQHSLEYGRDDVVNFLEKVGPPGTFRVLPIQEFQSNRYAGFGIASIGGYHAAKPRLYQDLVDSNLIDHPAWMRLLNVRYIIVPQPIPNPPPFLRPVFQGSASVYENLFALPRATVVGAYGVVQPAKAILDSVKSGTHDAASFTWLESDPQVKLGPVDGASATIASYKLNQVVVDVNTRGPALLRLADLYYPDWIAIVEGREVPVLKADYLLRAVAVPAGHHRVEFRFHSRALGKGLTLSLVSLAIALGLLAAGWLVARRPAAPAAEAA
jgi:hypothetical protein